VSRRPSGGRSRLRVLVVVPGDVGENMSGPAIRAWLLAEQLSRHHQVTAAIEGRLPASAPDGIRVVQATRRRLLSETVRHDAAMAACLPPYVLVAARRRGVITIADHYDPVELEMATVASLSRRLRAARAVRGLQHRYADVVLCASQAQLDMLAHDLVRAGRTGALAPLTAIVPFGLPEPPVRSGATPLRDRFPEISATDRIVLWWGKVWSWFDADSAIRAMAPLAASRPEIKLVITTGPAPDASTEAYSRDAQARALAAELGLLGATVFFLDEWIPYAQRHHVLHEVDIGLTLHAATPESAVAARARYMDFVWAGLPCVLAEGDEVSAEFGAAGFARLIPPLQPESATQAILALIDDADTLEAARAAAATVADRYRWSALAQTVCGVLDDAVRSTRPGRGTAGLAVGAARYYLRRGADAMALALSRSGANEPAQSHP
jgi:glycosyltransferase involved in cell wall biosynthesis